VGLFANPGDSILESELKDCKDHNPSQDNTATTQLTQMNT